MQTSIDLDELHQIPLFSALDEEQLESVLKHSRTISLKAKNILFEKGSEATHFYLLRAGEIKLYSLSEDGDEKVIEIIHPSQTFAEAIMFMPKQMYPVSAETLKESEICSFDMKHFRSFLENSQVS